MLISCGYTVEDWWEDIAQTQCECLEPNEVNECVDRQIEIWKSEGVLELCGDLPAPVEHSDVRTWQQDYLATCTQPDEGPPPPDDPNWHLNCSP